MASSAHCSPSRSGGCLVMRTSHRRLKGMSCSLLSSTSGDSPCPLIGSFGGLLEYYQVELQHLNPSGIQHIVSFVALCEGFLGISPHFDLWRYFFAVTLQKKWEKKQELNTPMGCTGIQL